MSKIWEKLSIHIVLAEESEKICEGLAMLHSMQAFCVGLVNAEQVQHDFKAQELDIDDKIFAFYGLRVVLASSNMLRKFSILLLWDW